MAAHLFVEPPALANVGPGLAGVVRSALAKRPEDRPSASALRAALVESMAGVDPVTRRALDAERRVDDLAKPREERAIGGAGAEPKMVRGMAYLWMPSGARSASLLSCLATSGIDARLAETADVPPGVIVLAGVDRLRELRATDRTRPVIVVDVGGPEETAEVIRLGADDMLLGAAPDADLVAKVRRLQRRIR
jgi:hypothetical protein